MVDTSVWIDFLNGHATPQTSALGELMAEGNVLLGDLVVAEVLQGIRHDSDWHSAKALFSLYPCVALMNCRRAEAAATHYRALRKLGVTIRKPVDVYIGSYCIAEGLSLLFTDRDFLPLVAHRGLRAAVGSAL